METRRRIVARVVDRRGMRPEMTTLHQLTPTERTEWATTVARYAEGMPASTVTFLVHLLLDDMAERRGDWPLADRLRALAGRYR